MEKNFRPNPYCKEQDFIKYFEGSDISEIERKFLKTIFKLYLLLMMMELFWKFMLREPILIALKQNTVLLMAGGFGTRLMPLTDDCPKPLLKEKSQ